MIITELSQEIKQENGPTFVKASDGSILAGDSLADILAHQAEHSHKIKLFDTALSQNIKFYNGSIKSVKVGVTDYDQFVSYLRANGWALRPAVTSGGYTATRAN
jgi:hypothetical protein